MGLCYDGLCTASFELDAVTRFRLLLGLTLLVLFGLPTAVEGVIVVVG